MKRRPTRRFQKNYISPDAKNYIPPNVKGDPLIQKRFFFKYGWCFWTLDLLSLFLDKEHVICQPCARTNRDLNNDLDIDGVKFVSVEVPATDSAIDPPIVPKDADDYRAAGNTETKIKWFIKQCRLQQGLRWDDGCMSIDDTGLRAVDSIRATKLKDKHTALEEAITLIYDVENKMRRQKITNECIVPMEDYYETLKHFVNESQLNDSDFFVARWKLSPDDKSATHSLLQAARKSLDRRDKISLIYLLLTYRGLYPADSIALLGRSISTHLLDDILEKLDVQTMLFPVDGYRATKNNLAKGMSPRMSKVCGAYDSYFDVVGSQRVLVSLSSTVRRTDEYLELWESFSEKGVPYSDRIEGIIISLVILVFNLSPLYWMWSSTDTYKEYLINVATQGSYFIGVTGLLATMATSWRSQGWAYHDMIVGKKWSTKLSHLIRKKSWQDKVPFFMKMVAHNEHEGAKLLSRRYNSYMIPGKIGIFELDCVFTVKDLVDAGYKVLLTSDRERGDKSVERFLWVDFERSTIARDFELCKEGRRMILKDGVAQAQAHVSTDKSALRDHMVTSYADIIVAT
ncbi:hypothetical protein BGZ58_001135 [Dissophora ornata]|nr:hypothetical protein BGZ58_001135 [Dissophora ornata]